MDTFPSRIVWLLIIGILLLGMGFYIRGNIDILLDPKSELNRKAKRNRKIGGILIFYTFLLAFIIYYNEHKRYQ